MFHAITKKEFVMKKLLLALFSASLLLAIPSCLDKKKSTKKVQKVVKKATKSKTKVQVTHVAPAPAAAFVPKKKFIK